MRETKITKGQFITREEAIGSVNNADKSIIYTSACRWGIFSSIFQIENCSEVAIWSHFFSGRDLRTALIINAHASFCRANSRMDTHISSCIGTNATYCVGTANLWKSMIPGNPSCRGFQILQNHNIRKFPTCLCKFWYRPHFGGERRHAPRRLINAPRVCACSWVYVRTENLLFCPVHDVSGGYFRPWPAINTGRACHIGKPMSKLAGNSPMSLRRWIDELWLLIEP